MERDRIVRSSSYADPLDILNGTDVIVENQTLFPSRIEPGDREYCLQTYKKIFKKLIPVYIFILFLMFELILACFNCTYEDENFIAIRILLFLSVLFLFGTFIYITGLLVTKEIPDIRDYFMSVFKYSFYLRFYIFVFGSFDLVPEMMTLNKIRNNSSAIDYLPCSINYYETVFVLVLIELCFVPFVIVIFLVLLIIVAIKKCQRKTVTNSINPK